MAVSVDRHPGRRSLRRGYLFERGQPLWRRAGPARAVAARLRSSAGQGRPRRSRGPATRRTRIRSAASMSTCTTALTRSAPIGCSGAPTLRGCLVPGGNACVTLFTEELPWLKGRDLELVIWGRPCATGSAGRPRGRTRTKKRFFYRVGTVTALRSRHGAAGARTSRAAPPCATASPRCRRCSNISARRLPGHGAKFLRPRDAGELHEILDRVLVGAAGGTPSATIRSNVLRLKDFRNTRRGVPHLTVSGKGEKTRYLPLHPGTNGPMSSSTITSKPPAMAATTTARCSGRPATTGPAGSTRRSIPTWSTGWCGGIQLRLASRSAPMRCGRRRPPTRSTTRPTC
jgi:hypothetical protein